MPRRTPIVMTLLLVVTACTTSTGSSTTTTQPGVTSTSAADTTTSSVPAQTTTTQPPVTTTAPDLSGVTGISDEVKGQLEQLIQDAQEIRGLPFLTPPVITVVSEAELEDRVRSDIVDETADFPADEALYKMLGLLAEDADYQQIVLDLYGEQVAGFYDGETGEIVVPTREDGFTVIQQATLVHEMVHDLTDQHFSFYPAYKAMLDDERLDEATAYQSLVEGDATLAEVQWLQTLTQEELGQFIAESLDIDSSTLDAAPRFLQESLLFPYDTGLAFVQDLYAEQGWSTVNDAYAELVDLPGSSEQVITPSDYGNDLPLEVDMPDVEVPGYTLERTSTWGEEGFRILLNQGSGASTMARAADGWGGDSYDQWFDGENAAMLIVYKGDTDVDQNELEDALTTFIEEDLPEDNFALVDQRNGYLYFIAADVPEVGQAIGSAVGLG